VSPTQSDGGKRLRQKASVDIVEKAGVETIEGRSSATKEVDQPGHLEGNQAAVAPRARLKSNLRLNQGAHMASAASLLHGGSPTTRQQAPAATRGDDSMGTIEQVQGPTDQGRQGHTVGRKQEAGNDDLSHLMLVAGDPTRPTAKKKLTPHAVSNTSPLRADFLQEASPEEISTSKLRMAQNQEERVLGAPRDTILLLDGDGAGEDESALGTV
jgi:hypothetical protein